VAVYRNGQQIGPDKSITRMKGRWWQHIGWSMESWPIGWVWNTS